MSKSLGLEWASMVYGPYDLPHMYEIFEGVLYKGCYFFYLDNGVLCLRGRGDLQLDLVKNKA
ncbi:hypothetical protein P4H71_14910 [Paenibacillus kribbensis]|uniref:hypothetical protein n=1 Tax=Paenibacillus kribbensis TaxID=172713 RepID=UPI002DBDE33F|nr:hypothetical protein [Paenibacillus kribbensis]MEC0235618.1 hypothetical protein [Paenibacillus kribbensis]